MVTSVFVYFLKEGEELVTVLIINRRKIEIIK